MMVTSRMSRPALNKSADAPATTQGQSTERPKLSNDKGYSYTYQRRTVEDVQRIANQTGNIFDGPVKSSYQFFKAKEGLNTLRILPPTWGPSLIPKDLNSEDTSTWKTHYGLHIWVHNDIGEHGGYLCPLKMFGKPCPICEERAALEQEGAIDPEEIGKLRAKKSVVYWIVDRNDEVTGPKFWVLGWTLDKEISMQAYNPRTGAVLYIDDPEQGFDVDFRRTGTKMNTKYQGVQIARDATPISSRPEDYDKIMKFIVDNPLPTILDYKDYDYIAQVFSGGALVSADDEAQPRTSVRQQAEAEDTRPAENSQAVLDDEIPFDRVGTTKAAEAVAIPETEESEEKAAEAVATPSTGARARLAALAARRNAQ